MAKIKRKHREKKRNKQAQNFSKMFLLYSVNSVGARKVRLVD
jgi:hypothetical protein